MWVKSLIGSKLAFLFIAGASTCDGMPGNLQRVAVGRRARDGFGADQAAAAGAVLDEELLAEGLAELVGEHAAEQIVGAAGRIGDDDAHRLVRPFGRGAFRQHRKNGETGGNGRGDPTQGVTP